MYAQAVLTPARRAALFLLVVVMPACSATGRAEQRSQLCLDLLNLQRTIDLVVGPSWDMSVGDLRSGLDKLEPTFVHVGASGVVPLLVKQALQDAHSAYQAAIGGVSDDAPFREVRYAVAVPAGRLGAAYGRLVNDMSCARRPAGTG